METRNVPPPVIWSVAGLDTAGGAGLSADQRAADAMGVHLCPVVASLTAQNSCGITALEPVGTAWLDAQFDALESDLSPRVIKTGLLGSVAAIRAVAARVDRLRAGTPAGMDPHHHLALIVDPVCRASAGPARPEDPALRQAQREWLLPRATVLTPNRPEALALLGEPADAPARPGLSTWPRVARALQAAGARSVVIKGGDAISPPDTGLQAWCLDWLQSPQACGWLVAPRVASPHHHGTGCTHATGVAAAIALGHGPADAAVLASMLTRHALAQGHAAGRGPGPVVARRGFALGPGQGGAVLPWLGLHEDLPWALGAPTGQPVFHPFRPPPDRLYGIGADPDLLQHWLDQGLQCLQWRHKAPQGLHDSLPGLMSAAARTGARLFINDHWRETLACPVPAPEPGQAAWVPGVHLGQEDLLALDAHDRTRLREAAPGLMLGLSSHSLWELARAAGCGPSLLACGPVKATTTKDMPWRPQGRRNLTWWVANSPAPVVGIGGLLTPEDLDGLADLDCAAWCLVRGLARGAPLAALRHAARRRPATGTPPAELPAPVLDLP